MAPDTYFIRVGLISGQGGYTVSSSFTAETTENDAEPIDS